MPGPYFAGQQPNPCGCYFPDVTRIGCDADTAESILFCTTHEEYRIRASRGLVPKSERNELPSEEWREDERQRLRGVRQH